MSIEGIIKWLEDMIYDPEEVALPIETVLRNEMAREAIALLKTHPDAQPNAPLTLEELRGMVGEPVWVRCISEPLLNGWQIVAGVDTEGCGTLYCEGEETFRYYGRAWLAYRRLPKEG